MAANSEPASRKESADELSRPARIYIGAVIAAGALALISESYSSLQIASIGRFATYLICGALASSLKVHLPGINGTMSVNFLLILMAIADLSRGEAVLIGALSITIQYLWYSRTRPTMLQAAFNVASISAAVAIAAWVYHWPILRAAQFDTGIILAITASVYFICNTLTIALVVAITEGRSVLSLWKECYFWSFPYYLVGAALVLGMRTIASYVGWQTAILVLPVVYIFYHSYRLYLDRLQSEKEHAEDMAGLHLRTIEALALAIEAKDHTTNEHLHRVQVYALQIGKELKLSPTDLHALEAASLLHDIGKLAVPEHIISKPGKLTPEEFDKMKIHPLVGAEILERVKFPYPVVPIVAAHHERWDGTGYPHGLSREDIPIGARILAAVDCLDALSSDRQYRKALPLQAAMDMVKAQSGKAFDPVIVEILERRLPDLENQAREAGSEASRLSREVTTASGCAPGAGFDEQQPLPSDPSGNADNGFLSSIAAARNEVQILFELSQSLGTSLSLVDTLSVLAQRLQTIVPHHSLAIYLQREGLLVPEYVNGDDAKLFGSLAIPCGQGLSGWVAEKGKPILNGNPSVEPGYLQDVRKFSKLQSALVVPLDGVGGRLGTLAIYHRSTHAFSKDHLRILLAISSKLGLSIENSLRFRHAESTAVTDFLTGLPNGRSVFMHLEQEVKRCSTLRVPLTVLVCDLDGFKQVNDAYGHLQGNRMLQLTAEALKDNLREGDYVGRMGGDEFVIVMPHTDAEKARVVGERMQAAIRDLSIRAFGSPVFGLSIGAAHLGPDTVQAEDLLAEADRQMYKTKRARKASGAILPPVLQVPKPQLIQ
jgi:diguanylate cyclase (GGDEF)-like protein/putative nucleotidyltransferase with HDIG domain